MDKAFIEQTLILRGKTEGAKWLKNIPIIIKGLEKRWSIKVGPPFKLFINYVAPVIRKDNSQAVLKICFPSDKEFKTEVESLKIFNGEGTVELLDEDIKQGAILIEKIESAQPLSLIDNDKQATMIIASLINQIPKPKPSNFTFPTLFDWFEEFAWLRQNFNGGTGPLSEKLVSEAEDLWKNLLKSQSTKYLLHGDLHHDNILSSQRQPYLAIDPKGIIGEKEFETAAMLRNPYEKLIKTVSLKEVLNTRIKILSEVLNLDEERIREWGIAQTVLAVIWTLQYKSEKWKFWHTVAETLSSGK